MSDRRPVSLSAPRPATWIKTTPGGLYCEPGDFYIDPLHSVPRAVITHGHGDHARSGNGRVLATPGTIAIMRERYGEAAGGSMQPLGYGERVVAGDATVRFVPAGVGSDFARTVPSEARISPRGLMLSLIHI